MLFVHSQFTKKKKKKHEKARPLTYIHQGLFLAPFFFFAQREGYVM